MRKSVNKDTSKALIRLIDKVIVYRFTRNLDRALDSRDINHSELSQATGRASNWFNHTINSPEDMRMTTFLKVSAAVSSIIRRKSNHEKGPLTFEELFDYDLVRLASFANDMRTDNIEALARMDPTLHELFVGLRVFVEGLKGRQKKASTEELEAFEQAIQMLEVQRRHDHD